MTFNLTVPASTAPLALQVTLQPTSGDPDLIIFLIDPFGSARMHTYSIASAGHDIETVDALFLPAGQEVAIQVFARETRADFSLSVDLFEEGRQVSPRDAKALAAISAACCQNGTCASEAFTRYATDPAAMNPCDVPGWYCNSAGHVTHMILADAGFQCTAADLKPFAQMKDIHQFVLDRAPGVSGDINTFLSHFQGDHGLRVLEVLSTSMAGMLPAQCEAGHHFNKVVRLLLDDMQISGHIPDCLMRTESLFIARTNIHEALPEAPPDSPMRRLTLIQLDDGKPRIKGDAAAFANLANLQYLLLTYTGFGGTLRVGPALRELTTIGLPFTHFAAASQSRLSLVYMIDGRLAGAVPPELLNDSDLLEVMLRNNSLSSIDQDFSAMQLRILDISHNNIEGTLPPALGTQPSLLYINAGHNRFSGPLDLFSRSVAAGSLVHYFDIAGNQLTGPLSGLEDLGVLTATGTLLGHPETGVIMPNVLNASSNNFEGALPLSYYAASSAGGPDQLPLVIIDIRGNKLMECPDPEITNPMVQVACDPAAATAAGGTAAEARPVPAVTFADEADAVLAPAPRRVAGGAAGGSGGAALSAGALAGIVVAAVAAALVAALVAVVALRRYKQQKQDAWTAATLDEGAPASAGVGHSDASLK